MSTAYGFTKLLLRKSSWPRSSIPPNPPYIYSPLRGFHPHTAKRASQPEHITRSSLSYTIVRSSIVDRSRSLLLGTGIALTLFAGYFYVTDTRSGIHRFAPTVLQWLYEDAEDAHETGNAWLKGLYAAGLYPRERQGGKLNSTEADLSIQLFGQRLDNPIGTSAGIDKFAEIPDPLLELGPGIIEIGCVTPNPQTGNVKPRVFRLPSQKALINRYGFNSDGAEDVQMRLRHRVRAFAYGLGYGTGPEGEQLVLDGRAGVPGGSLRAGQLLAVQIGKNKTTDETDVEAVKRDYVNCVEVLSRYADILVVNVSSPNTPGLRTLQRLEPLTSILKAVVETTRTSCGKRQAPAIMVKVSPDEDRPSQVRDICTAALSSDIDGLIVANTTKSRPLALMEHAMAGGSPLLPPKEAQILLEEPGGFSGPQTFHRTKDLVSRYRQELNKQQQNPRDDGQKGRRRPIFASGGITTGAQALEILEAGADVAQIYTALVYEGLGGVTKMKTEMRDEMRRRLQESTE